MSNFISEGIAVKKKLSLFLVIAASSFSSHSCNTWNTMGPLFDTAEVVEVVVTRLA